VPGSKAVILRNEDHFLFIAHEGEVLREMKAFMGRLHQSSVPEIRGRLPFVFCGSIHLLHNN